MLAAGLLLAFAVLASAQTLTDDFSKYADGDEGWPAWQASAVGIGMRNHSVEADGGVLQWREAPYAAAVTFTCELTVQSEAGQPTGWATAGIGLRSDERNYWQLNLVRAPEKEQFRHYLELHECLDGQWLAESQEGSRLPRKPGGGDTYNWQVNQTYTLELALTPTEISGRIAVGEQAVGRFAYDLAGDGRPVRGGRPCLRVNSMAVRFDNAKVVVAQTAPEPKDERQFPVWTPQDAEKLTEGTGFFSTYRDKDGRWWLVDPEGKAYFDVGTDHCNYSAHFCQALGYAPYNRNMEKKYGGPDAWAEVETARLKSWSFNTLAAGHHPSTRHRGLSHILFASMGSRFAPRDWICEPLHWTGFPNVFSPDWERHCRLVARQIAKEGRRDPWCLGTFFDNELEWYGKQGDLVDELFQLGADHTAKRAFWDWLRKRYSDVAGVSKALGTDYADAAAFLAATAVPPQSEQLAAVREAFLTVIAERYFKACYEALKEADPEHLTWGCRFAGRAPEAALAVAGRYTDVFTINTYPRVDLDTGRLLEVQRQFRDYYAKVQKPFVITEWSFPALDSGLPCKNGAGMRVDTQAQKARCYQVFADAMIELPFMIGYHYFMWVDEPAQGISDTFPEDSNYGLVNVNDEPYTELVETASRVNAAAHQRHKLSQYSGDVAMAFVGGKLTLRNDTQWPARGKLSAFGGGRMQTADVAVPAGEAVTPAGADWGKAAYVLLQQWDGTVTRLAPAARAGKLEAVNAGLQLVGGVPTVRDGQQPALAWLHDLAPGTAVALKPLTKALTPVEQLDLTTEQAAFRCASRSGRLFDGVGARANGQELHLGPLDFAVHLTVNGQHQWVVPDAVEETLLGENDDAWIVEATLVRKGEGDVVTAVDDAGKPAPQQAGPGRFRARVRAVVFKSAPLALVRPLWVESLDKRPWQLVDCFWFCRPAIGGAEADDRKGGPSVPNYYHRAEYWTDAKLGGAFGALSPDDSWNVHFWADEGGGFHPDARREVDRTLAQSERWTADDWPYLWVYALRTEAEVNDMIRRANQAADVIVSGR